MHETLSSANPKSIVVLHASAYNPTGVQPSLEQWGMLADLFKSKDFITVFDSPAQGIISGNLFEDSKSIRIFVEQKSQVIVAQNLSTSLGLYGDRIGALHITCNSKLIANKVLDQLKYTNNMLRILPKIRLGIRQMYSNPPCNGVWIALKLLNKPEFRLQLDKELKSIAERYKNMRRILFEELSEAGNDERWQYITQGEGPFLHINLSGIYFLHGAFYCNRCRKRINQGR